MSSSRRICSSAESTSLRVDTWCCASTARHGESRNRHSLESPAHCVQILDDIDQSFDGFDSLGGDAGHVLVLGEQPEFRLVVVTAHERVETSEQAEEEQGELALLRLRIESPAVLQAGHRGFAGPNDGRKVPVAKAEPAGRRYDRLCDNLRRVAPGGAEWKSHHMKYY